MTSELLQVESVNKRFGGTIANQDISLSIPEGGIIGLIGPNGSGKTTLFNSIVGYHPIDSGTIKYEGRDITELSVPAIARLGMLRTFQQTRIYGQMTCIQNMQISAPFERKSIASLFTSFPEGQMERINDLLTFVGLYSKRNLLAGDLSFGQQKLLEFAMALIAEPRLLLLDEPTAGINPTLINGLIDRLKVANQELGITLFIIEHNMRVIMNIADHIYCLAHGKMLAEGPPDEIQNNQRVIDAYLGAD
ncbi:MAG: ABC transporter ATP-binding protein [Acidiferrobacterales bacterium]